MDLEAIELTDLRIIVTAVTVLVLYFIKMVIRKLVFNRMKHLEYSRERRFMIGKVVNLFLLILLFVAMLATWGVDSQDVLLFVSSIATVLGVAFFAQWSILSNITASLIIFFNHPVRIGCHIKILDKDFPIEGTVKDITSFFIKIEDEDGKEIMMPTAVILQKSISVQN